MQDWMEKEDGEDSTVETAPSSTNRTNIFQFFISYLIWKFFNVKMIHMKTFCFQLSFSQYETQTYEVVHDIILNIFWQWEQKREGPWI